MCIAFWLLDKHPAFWLVLALNRDEFHARPTLPIHFWDEDEEGAGGNHNILGGRDMRSGGTWMGITKSGRLAFLTNVREKDWNDRPDRGTSRGDLPTRFLKGHQTPREFADLMALESHNYSGFNLVVADFSHGEMVFVSNRHGQATAVPPLAIVRTLDAGLHALSNGTLDSKWPKMERGKKLFADVLLADGAGALDGRVHGKEDDSGHIDGRVADKGDGPGSIDGKGDDRVFIDGRVDGRGDGRGCVDGNKDGASSDCKDSGDGGILSERIVKTVLSDGVRVKDVSIQMAETHCGEEFEIPVSSIFVREDVGDQAYGTRSMTVVRIRRDGLISLSERYLENGVWKDHSFEFQVKG